ncbi:MAG TPA: UDP-N-acetylmuramoyl-L-alanyl-D-glutamate--2,6-diaminopimelate ligase [Acidimicrobiales bacterium]|nr:UDP-N-acetylmuramoyl-L-alanyl-D-glutamate--2,6-diaminopimelate ligase [Acidimicrobiales bacterium]
MRLDQLVRRALGGSDLLAGLRGDASVDVTDVSMDSRAVRPGTMFACVRGATVDGHTFASVAVSAGAVALLCDHPLELAVPQVVVRSVRAALGPLSSAVHDDPSRSMTVVGVTGTNGKTTTCALLAGVFEANGWPAATLGTLTQERTTPEAPELQSRLAGLRREGRRALAMEVSSHALDQHRVDGTRFAAGVLTNVTQDHLDYHHTMERYFAAKARLFEDGRSELAVLNRDDPWAARLVERLSGGPVPLHTFGLSDARELRIEPEGSRFRWDGVPVELHLGGRFNVANALAAACCARALGVTAAVVADGLGAVRRVPGRFERVDAGQPFTVLVDYAHTPDGLRQALTAARELTAGRLIVVFGAGGDRDHDKRPLMGRAAADLADLVVITSDNPRSEDPVAIIDQVAAGAVGDRPTRLVPDRAEAIETAIWIAAPGDVVVVAGKGHEQGQEVAGRRLPFDDVAVARQAIERVTAARPPSRPAPSA